MRDINKIGYHSQSCSRGVLFQCYGNNKTKYNIFSQPGTQPQCPYHINMQFFMWFYILRINGVNVGHACQDEDAVNCFPVDIFRILNIFLWHPPPPPPPPPPNTHTHESNYVISICPIVLCKYRLCGQGITMHTNDRAPEHSPSVVLAG